MKKPPLLLLLLFLLLVPVSRPCFAAQADDQEKPSFWSSMGHAKAIRQILNSLRFGMRYETARQLPDFVEYGEWLVHGEYSLVIGQRTYPFFLYLSFSDEALARIHILFAREDEKQMAEPDIAALRKELLPILDFEYGARLYSERQCGTGAACAEWGWRYAPGAVVSLRSDPEAAPHKIWIMIAPE